VLGTGDEVPTVITKKSKKNFLTVLTETGSVDLASAESGLSVDVVIRLIADGDPVLSESISNDKAFGELYRVAIRGLLRQAMKQASDAGSARSLKDAIDAFTKLIKTQRLLSGDSTDSVEHSLITEEEKARRGTELLQHLFKGTSADAESEDD
jgi:hypothetical protein